MPKVTAKRSAAVGAALAALVGGFEGFSRVAYPDPATLGPPWTICYGHTEGVKPRDRKTTAECKALLAKDLEIYGRGIENCTTVFLPDDRYIALVSFAYNVGVPVACRSSVVRLINQNKPRQGCDALLLYDKAKRKIFPGLQKRRAIERQLCLKGLS